MRFVVLLGSIVWAAWHVRHDVRLLRYFAAQYLYTVILEMVITSGARPTIYAWAYAVMSLVTLLTAASVVSKSLESRAYRLRILVSSLVMVVCMGRFTFVWLPHRANLGDWITFLEGIAYLWMGMLLSYAAAYEPRADIPLALGLLWLGLGLFDLGYFLQNEWAMWRELNLWLPAAMCVTAFGVIGWRVKEYPSCHTSSS